MSETGGNRTGDEVNVDRAIRVARAYFDRVYADEGVVNVMLEEVLESDDGHWSVTIGFHRSDRDGTGPSESGERPPWIGPQFFEDRFYKRITVDRSTGEVLGMSIRQPLAGL